MLPIQMRRRRQRNKKLTPISIRARVSHAKNAFVVVLERGHDFVLEFAAPDALAAAAGAVGVAALDHEAWNDAVENDLVVVTSLCERAEVSACLWCR